MSDPVVKNVKASSSSPALHRAATSSLSAKDRKFADPPARSTIHAKLSPTEKPPVRKAVKSKPTTVAKSTDKPKRAASSKSSAAIRPVVKVAAKAEPAPKAKQFKGTTVVSNQSKVASSNSFKSPVTAAPVHLPAHDEAAALRAFDGAHKLFVRGHFAEARRAFRTLIERYPGVSEVTARARTYLAVAETRLSAESAPPTNADTLYDRGVVELNRGEYVVAQEFFERALQHESEAAHIHYSLAATRSRLGALSSALASLERALDLQPNLRLRAQHDYDLVLLRNDPDFERLVSAIRR